MVRTESALEVLGLNLFDSTYDGKKVLVTGHTGFKGSWLSLWLSELGAEVTGLSLPPETEHSHWNLLNLTIDDRRCDIRDVVSVKQIIKNIQPEIVFHLAAQPLVRRSYRDPLETWSTNVMGTANVLEACRHTPSVQAIVAITTDKCYENYELSRGYREDDRLGGYDPYSASKAGSELVAASYRRAFLDAEAGALLATARAGNVIGGGDWSEDRLIPDLIRAISEQKSLEIRSPNATRPWQHVLESLSGYLVLGQKLLMGYQDVAGPWNFGPEPESNQTVSEVLRKLNNSWADIKWHETGSPQPHEAILLYLDSDKAHRKLNWQPVWNIDCTIEKTADWYKQWLQTGHVISRQQLASYVADASYANIEWANS